MPFPGHISGVLHVCVDGSRRHWLPHLRRKRAGIELEKFGGQRQRLAPSMTGGLALGRVEQLEEAGWGRSLRLEDMTELE
jgi:hypothetical protein